MERLRRVTIPSTHWGLSRCQTLFPLSCSHQLKDEKEAKRRPRRGLGRGCRGKGTGASVVGAGIFVVRAGVSVVGAGVSVAGVRVRPSAMRMARLHSFLSHFRFRSPPDRIH